MIVGVETDRGEIAQSNCGANHNWCLRNCLEIYRKVISSDWCHMSFGIIVESVLACHTQANKTITLWLVYLKSFMFQATGTGWERRTFSRRSPLKKIFAVALLWIQFKVWLTLEPSLSRNTSLVVFAMGMRLLTRDSTPYDVSSGAVWLTLNH